MKSMLEKLAEVVDLNKVDSIENKSTESEVSSEKSKGIESVKDKPLDAQPELKVDVRQTKFVSDDMLSLLNDQIGFEMFSAYLYFMIAAWSQSKGLTGFKKHFETQGNGEICHAMKIYKYLVDTGSKVNLPAIPSPSSLATFSNMQEACRAALDHEMLVTKRWSVIGEKAKQEHNLATQEMAQWFMSEQIEEEDLSLTLLNKVELADSGSGLLIIDSGLK